VTIFLVMYNIMCFTPFVPDVRVRYNLGYIVCGIISFNIVVNLGSTVKSSIRANKLSYYTYKAKAKYPEFREDNLKKWNERKEIRSKLRKDRKERQLKMMEDAEKGIRQPSATELEQIQEESKEESKEESREESKLCESVEVVQSKRGDVIRANKPYNIDSLLSISGEEQKLQERDKERERDQMVSLDWFVQPMREADDNVDKLIEDVVGNSNKVKHLKVDTPSPQIASSLYFRRKRDLVSKSEIPSKLDIGKANLSIAQFIEDESPQGASYSRTLYERRRLTRLQKLEIPAVKQQSTPE